MSSSNSNSMEKELCYYLRHNPMSINLNMTVDGWVNLQELCTCTQGKFSPHVVKDIVHRDIKRYELNSNNTCVRALHGHSLPWVDLKMQNIVPPEFLYHGTSAKFMESINETGLLKMSRNFVHMTENFDLAFDTGLRHTNKDKNNVVVLRIDSKGMQKDGYKFCKTNKEVWLTLHVPAKYISII